MSISDDDEDLKKAIALSLQEQEQKPTGGGGKEAINLDSDEDAVLVPVTLHVEPQTPPASTQAFLGRNRKAMEQERLARKRKASVSPPPARKAAKLSSSSTDVHRNSSGSQVSQDPPLSGPVFLRGVVKKTWAFGHVRNDDIKIEEILHKTDLTLAVLSSFQWDVDWLLNKINTRTTQLYFVMQAKDEVTKRQYRQETASMPNLRLCFPSMEGQVNCMHSKLMLLSYPTHLRVVVPTANLVPYDWGESGIMENMMFVIDLPRLPKGELFAADITAFGRELVYFLKAMGLEHSVIESLNRFDFSMTKDLAFVHTIGGAHEKDETWRRTGYCGLGRAVKELGLVTDKSLLVDFVTSSVGSLNIDFLTTLYLAAQGDDGLTEYNWRNSKPSKTKVKGKADHSAIQSDVQSQVDKHFHIYFPTRETVLNSTGGAPSGGTICFQPKWYDSPTFPRHLLRDCRSQRKGLLMHNKLILVRPQPSPISSSSLPSTPSTTDSCSTSSPPPSTSWFYIGSANCSSSAWGNLLSKSRTTKSPKLNCRNWECGVIVPLRRGFVESDEKKKEGGERASEGEDNRLGEFKGILPMPMVWPGEEYGSRRPWFNAEG